MVELYWVIDMRKKWRRRRRKKKNNRLKLILLVIGILILILIMFLIYYLSGVFKGNDSVTLDVFDEYKSEIKVKSFFRDVTDKVKIEGNVDTNKIGKYELTYKYKTLFGYSKSMKVNVLVRDKEKPVIELVGGDRIEVFLDDKFKEPGYNVSDNYDKELEVKITGEVDTSKTGSYYLVYKTSDSSNNQTEVVRKIVVERKSPLSMGLTEFNLDSYFEGTILKETNKMDNDYINNMVLAGDSVPWQFGLNYVFTPSRVWAKPCEGPNNFYSQKVYVNNKQTNYTLADLIKENKPKYLTIHMGICETNQDNIDSFIKSYGKAIDYIRENSPDTKLIVMSLMPQTNEYLSWIPLRNNAKINKYNYYLAELCYNKGVKFLNASTVVKDNRGMGNPNLFFDDGYHPNITGMKKILNYINNHGYME